MVAQGRPVRSGGRGAENETHALEILRERDVALPTYSLQRLIKKLVHVFARQAAATLHNLPGASSA